MLSTTQFIYFIYKLTLSTGSLRNWLNKLPMNAFKHLGHCRMSQKHY